MAMTGARDTGAPWERWGWLMAVVWMVFLVYPVVSLVDSVAPLGWRLLGWASLVLFALLYIIGFVHGMRGTWHRPGRLVVAIFWVLLLCAALAVPAIGSQALSFVPFLMSYAAYGLGRTWHWWASAGGLTAVLGAILLTGDLPQHGQMLGIIVMIAVVNTISTWLIGRSLRSEELRVQMAASEERSVVARDVHDLLGHSLTAVKLKAELARRLIDEDPSRTKAELDDIVRLATEAIGGVRSTVTGLRGAGFAEELTACAAAFEGAGIAVETTGDPDALSPAQSLPAGWILREATTNVLRHAAATVVRITVEPGTVLVEDDGRGLRGPAGNGLRGMAERAAAAGATLRVEEAASGGTRVSVVW
ncbi:sensor histidine kinase [Microbacterium oryzae]|uniref:Sensor histidine kinase n=1 Tax=Microbacterium oryzae TaxID=743009 RepID=A0A6I6E1G8_9MICO|nr:histidine kinase [Microbacterium oryzae]QGU28973.1 sensor histidine kinase [Microbacterium oryzae]